VSAAITVARTVQAGGVWNTAYGDLAPLTERAHGPELTLRPLTAADEAALRADHDARWDEPFLPALFDHDRTVAAGWAAGAAALWTAGEALRLAVTDADLLVGTVDLHGIDRHRGVAGIGWRTLRGRTGRGYARRAGAVLARSAHTALGLHRVQALVAAGNHASRAAAAGAGLHLEAVLRAAGPGSVARSEVPAAAAARTDVEVWRLLADEDPLEPQPQLSAGVLHLRPLLPRDAQVIARACQDPLSQQWLPMLPRPYTAQDGADYIAGALGGWAGVGEQVWGFCDATTAELLGVVGLKPAVLAPGWRELGWHCFPWGRGHGHTAAAAGAVARYARARQGAERIDALIDPANTASQRVAAKAGMVLEGTLGGALPRRGETRTAAQVWHFPL
jgi:RimJ/RimL family protein N-acetyltransferase